MNNQFFDFHKYPYDGERISPATVYPAQHDRARLDSRYSLPLKRGEEQNLTLSQQEYLMNRISGGQSKKSTIVLIIILIPVLYTIFKSLDVMRQSLPDNPLLALLLSVLFLVMITTAALLGYHHIENHKARLLEAIEQKNYKVYAYNIDNKKWSVARGGEGTDWYFYLYVNGIYLSVDSHLYLAVNMEEPILGVIISTEKGDYFYLVPAMP